MRDSYPHAKTKLPFLGSTLVNAASTKALWDKVLAAKGGAS
jgi:hypothetical protein